MTVGDEVIVSDIVVQNEEGGSVERREDDHVHA
jgi:hypothetical protein